MRSMQLKYLNYHLHSPLDKNKRNEWKIFYENSIHPEDDVKNVLINQTNRICPGFKYLMDFEWEVEKGHANEGKGDLIFGSDYGIYLIIETKFLHPGSGKTAQVSRHNAKHKVKEQAKRYRELATEIFKGLGVEFKVIGATFTNEDDQIYFLDDDDKKIAELVAKEFRNPIFVFMDWMFSLCIVSLCLFGMFGLFYLFSVFLYKIILDAFGKSHRYYISYVLGIPYIIILFTFPLGLLIITLKGSVWLIKIQPNDFLRCGFSVIIAFFLTKVLHKMLEFIIVDLLY
ncbi:hypothetical protein Glove_51g38 [Diversispora epigaea]|uniref:Uncharacterized protein n=1 Tax=Diversispora epigaea TaxID=1348612 RepID=A0A397JDJ3_9GLOM|nr:hypothetical protein Glove_51g38 [Diversispora epigaea]